MANFSPGTPLVTNSLGMGSMQPLPDYFGLLLFVIAVRFSVLQDEACAAVDEEKLSSPSEYETDEEWEEQRKKKQADQLKEQVSLSSVTGGAVFIDVLVAASDMFQLLFVVLSK